MFTYALSWNAIDHQRGDGNDFGFYRDGEWLTKERTGYSSGASYTDYHNSLSIENDPPAHNDREDPRHEIWLRGDQWVLDPAGDPRVLARAAAPGYVYATGDATNLYNSRYEGVTDVLYASRSIVWLKPDVIVVYDRAATRSKNRFKRFWLQLPTAPTITGARTKVGTGRQQLFVTTLLPLRARVTATRDENVGEPAIGEPMRYRLRVEDPRSPRVVRFLDVLQGAALRARPSRVTLLRTTGTARYAGAAVGDTAVLFPVRLRAAFARLQLELPRRVRRILVTGLRPGAGYTVTQRLTGSGIRLSIVAGGPAKAGHGGVLTISRDGPFSGAHGSATGSTTRRHQSAR